MSFQAKLKKKIPPKKPKRKQNKKKSNPNSISEFKEFFSSFSYSGLQNDKLNFNVFPLIL